MRSYTAAERAEAVALAATIGPVKAAAELDIPRRTVASWLHRPAASPIIAATDLKIADRVEQLLAKSLAALDATIPKARPGELAKIVEVLATQRNLAEGRATAYNANLNVNVEAGANLFDLTDDEARDMIALIDDELRSRPDPSAEPAP